MTISSLGSGYNDIVKCVADYMLLRHLIDDVPNESFFPLVKNRGLNSAFYKDQPFQNLKKFTDIYFKWYHELATNKRAFAPLHYDDHKHMAGWIKHMELDAKDDSYYLLEMIKASNAYKDKVHSNKFRFFLQFAYDAINYYTKKMEV